jgi:hypothetical protein
MNILKMLEKEEKKMAGRLGALQAAISALSGGNSVRAVSKLKGRKLSRSHRMAIKAAWAKRRAAQAKA